MNKIQPTYLVDTIAKQLFVPQGAFLEYRVAVQVMVLPDTLYQQFFVQLALELNASRVELTKTFFHQIVMKHLLVPSSSIDITLKLETKEPRFRQNSSGTQSIASLAFQNKFTTGLIEVLASFQKVKSSFQDNAQLCKAVNEHFILNSQLEFWKKVATKISGKSCQQLRDYYQKSFLRCMFQECISSQDKVLLCNLINQMKGQKPSVIVERFFETVGTDKYFKRNVVMYIVNRKQK
ncbi:SANT/Myb_domain [Hexamita inflata]|uniref:SANT/Myb domain n=1 Tax=Hexamita inflata TaxID=28002 RepID=A0AA86Q8T5_9EUKA|nr:SANT/Myb domain [Hexamita inflata]